MNVVYLDTCLPGYFQGFEGREDGKCNVLAVPVFAGMTYDQIVSGLIDDYNRSDSFPEFPDLREKLENAYQDKRKFVKETLQFVEPQHDEDDEFVYQYWAIVD